MEIKGYTDYELKPLMQSKDFEIGYLNGMEVVNTGSRLHHFYEVVFLFHGKIQMWMEQMEYLLQAGSVMLIPPGVFHEIKMQETDGFYEGFVICLTTEYFEKLLSRTDDYGYVLRHSIGEKNYVYSLESEVLEKLHQKVLCLMEEQNAERFGKAEQMRLQVVDLFLTLNRVIYEMLHKEA